MDEYWLEVCLKLGREAMVTGNAPVGSVIIKAGELIGEGREAGKSKNDITCHAEIEAIRDAIQKGFTDLTQATLYTTHEPCIMCSYVIRHHKIQRVVMGLEVPEIGGLTSAYLILKATEITAWGPEPEILTGVLRQECLTLDQEYRNKQN